jgi:hypothetical protein
LSGIGGSGERYAFGARTHEFGHLGTDADDDQACTRSLQMQLAPCLQEHVDTFGSMKARYRNCKRCVLRDAKVSPCLRALI